MNVTYSDLIGFCLFVVPLAGLCYQIFKGKKYPPLNERPENMARLPEASNKCPARKFSALPHGRADFYREET